MATSAPGAAPSALSSANRGATLAQAQAALQARDYQKAVEATLGLAQQRQMTPEQARAAQNQMLQLQQALALAVNSGDLRAKAAADTLRQAAAHH